MSIVSNHIRIVSAVERSNRQLPAEAPAILVIKAKFDHNGTLSSYRAEAELARLGKTHFIALQTISLGGKNVGISIRQSAQQLKERSIKTLIFLAHANGEKKIVAFGNNWESEKVYSVADVTQEDFACLPRDATIICWGCNSEFMGRKIAEVQPRPVFALTQDFFIEDNSFVVPCCDGHGYGLWAFDKEERCISRRYQQKGNELEVSFPCFESFGKISKLKSEVFQWMEFEAQQGNPNAQCGLGVFYLFGKEETQSDEKAAHFFLKAALQGDISAQTYMGGLCTHGRGVKQSFSEAFKWYSKVVSSENPLPESLCQLGILHLKGLGVERNESEGIRLIQRAAEAGFEHAKFTMGGIYFHGEGTPRSYRKAAEWFFKLKSPVYDTLYSFSPKLHRYSLPYLLAIESNVGWLCSAISYCVQNAFRCCKSNRSHLHNQ